MEDKIESFTDEACEQPKEKIEAEPNKEEDISRLDSSEKKIKDTDSEVKRFKRIMVRSLVVCVAKALMLGLAVALPVVGLLFMLKRFEITALKDSNICLIGIGALLIVGAAVFFALRKTSKQVAIKLDKDYKLMEKIQTMLAFKDKEGPMLDLQRQDASKALDAVKNKVIGLKRIWIYALCLVIGIAACCVSFMFNPVPPPPDPPEEEEPFEATELQLSALTELIEYVNGSEMQDPYKTSVSLALTTLYEEIKTATTMNQRDDAIAKAMDEIYLQTDQSSEAVELMEALWGTNAQAARRLAKALNYYDWPKTNDWDRFVEKMSDFKSGFVHKDAETPDADKQLIIDETKNTFAMLSIGILSSLEAAEVDNEDELFTVLLRLASAKEINPDGTRVYGMKTLSEYIVEAGYDKAQRELDATIKALNGDIYRALSGHRTNTNTGEYAMTSIASIFGVKAPDFKRPQLVEFETESGGSGEGGGTSGGISGGPSYGSDDKVYDPYTNRYVEYGTILDKYYSIMFNKLQGGSYTEAEQKALEEYFKILYGGFEDETNDNE